LKFVTLLVMLTSILAPLRGHAEASQICFAGDDGACRVVATSIALSVGDEPSGSAILLYAADSSLIGKVIAATDLQKQVQSGSLSTDEATGVLAELSSRHDVSYRIPDQTIMLKKSVGLIPETPLSPEDQVEMVKVHIQLTMGVSPATSSYLANLMGLAAVPAPVDSEPESAAASNAEASPEMPAPSASELTPVDPQSAFDTQSSDAAAAAQPPQAVAPAAQPAPDSGQPQTTDVPQANDVPAAN
jgi:hypothetical protein